MKTTSPPGYQWLLWETHALGHMMYGYKLLVPKNQKLLKKLSKERNISIHKSSTTGSVLKSHRSKMGIIYM